MTQERSELMLQHWRRRTRRAQQRAGEFGLSAGVAMDLRMGWDLGLEADQVNPQKRCSDEKPHLLIVSPMCLVFSQVQALNTKPDRLEELLEQGRRHLEFARSLAESQVERGGRVLFEHPVGGDVAERAVPEKVVGVRWHAQGPMRPMSVRNDFG